MEFIKNVAMVMVIIFLVRAIYPKDSGDSDNNIAKYEAAIKSWALTAATNLAIGIILLLIEKYILN